METTTLFLSGRHAAPLLRAPQDAATPLRDAVQRALRGHVSGWTVLALHLSRLAPPAPRPHHRRIARAVLDDAASRHRGQLFTLANGDLALLFAPSDRGSSLKATLSTLFATSAAEAELFLSRWLLPDQLDGLTAFLDALPAIGAGFAAAEQEVGLLAVTTLFNAVDLRHIRELLERQTGALVTTGGAERVVPLYREIRFSLPALEARAAALGHVTADPFLFRHLTAKLERAMLSATVDDLEHDRPILAGVRGGKTFMHVNMSIEAVLSPSFTALADVAARANARVAVEIALLEAFADMDNFRRARARIQQAGLNLVLDDVTHPSLLMTKLAVFGCDWLKLDWSRQLMQSSDMIDDALDDFGAAKVILQKADTEEAVRWGITRGIRRFQGRHIDAILAARHLTITPADRACTFRKGTDWKQAVTQSGRTDCLNHELLDAAATSAEHNA